jgi:hypothetical protein
MRRPFLFAAPLADILTSAIRRASARSEALTSAAPREQTFASERIHFR